MSGTVDLMVVGMAEQMSANELSNRLVEEFKHPADAFDALVSAATGAGPAYAAQSGVSLDLALEGKDKLESLGLVCNIPGFTDSESANSAVIADASGDDGDSVDDTDLADLTFASAAIENAVSENADVENAREDSVLEEFVSDAAAANDATDVDSDDDLLASFDELSFDETSTDDSPETNTTTDDAASTAASTIDESDAEAFDLDFSDELGAIGTESSAPETTEATQPSTDAETDELDFGDSLHELAVDASSADEVKGVSEVAESSDELDTLDNVADLAEIGADTADAVTTVESDATGSAEIDISDIALSEDNDAPLTKPRENSNVELDDGGLSLAADDSIAPIKTSATDVPAALANCPATDADVLSLSLDDSSTLPVSGASAKSGANTVADAAGDEQPDTVANLINASDDANSDFSIDTVEASKEDALTDSAVVSVTSDVLDNADVSPLDEQGEAPAQSVEVSVDTSANNDVDDSSLNDDDSSADVDTVELGGAISEQEQSLESVTEAGTIAPVAELETDAPSAPAQNEAPDAQSSAVESASAAAGSVKSIAEELIESLQGSDTPTANESEPVAAVGMHGSTVTSVDARSSFAVDDEQEQLRKSREQVAVLQEKIEEDLEEEEQVYQEFEQIARQRTVQKAVAGVAAVAAVAAIGAGVHFSGILNSAQDVSMPATVAVVEPQRDHEQESLNAAIERSATLINPENLSTEELLMSLAQGSGQDTLGDLRRYILGGSASRVAKTSDAAESAPRVGAAIPADSDSMKLLKNRVAHSGDKYFDKWSRREIDLRLYIELVDRLIDAGDIVAATELCNRTKDNLFAVMGKQSVARAYKARGDLEEALDMLQSASRSTYSIASAPERVVAMADYAYSEHVIGQREDALDSYLSVSILAASLNRSEYKTIGHAAVSDYLMRAGLESEGSRQLGKAIEAAHELPGNSAARDLALRHIALTEARMGLFEDAIKHTDEIIDPFASVSAYHGIALEYEARKDYAMATEVIQKAFDASSVITDKEKRRQLLSKIQLANTD